MTMCVLWSVFFCHVVESYVRLGENALNTRVLFHFLVFGRFCLVGSCARTHTRHTTKPFVHNSFHQFHVSEIRLRRAVCAIVSQWSQHFGIDVIP